MTKEMRQAVETINVICEVEVIASPTEMAIQDVMDILEGEE